jgi:hypothetical protein
MPQGRWFRPKPKELLGTPYDSLTEQRLHNSSLHSAIFHPLPIKYVTESKYNPDFYLEDKNIYIEVKAILQDAHEIKKYPAIKKAMEDMGAELVFVFENPNKPIHFYKRRADGSKLTLGEWATKNGFRWFSEDNIGDLLNE